MRRQLPTAAVVFVVFSVLTGLIYPLVVTGIAQVAFGARADGSLVERDGVVVGSTLIGQSFAGPGYFHPRPSSAGEGYDAMASGASNLGPSNPELLDAVAERKAEYRRANGLAAGERVPWTRSPVRVPVSTPTSRRTTPACRLDGSRKRAECRWSACYAWSTRRRRAGHSDSSATPA